MSAGDPTKISSQPPPNPDMPSGDAVMATSKKSRGEHLFNWLAYGGFAGAITFALGVPMGYWLRYSHSGQQTMKWAADYLKRVGVSQHGAEDAVMTTALMQGGNITLLGVQAMENHKPKLVEKFNHRLGDEVDDAISLETEKQTAGSLLKARLVAWLAVFGSLRGVATIAGKESFDNFEKKFAEHVVCKPLGQATHIHGEETTLFKLGRIGAIDLFATTAAATLLYLGSRIFAKRAKDQEIAQAAPLDNPQATEEKSVPEKDCVPCRLNRGRRNFVDMVTHKTPEAEHAAQP